MAVTKGKIEITFTRDVLNGETISFNRKHNASLTETPLASTFVSTPRFKSTKLSITTPTGTPGEAEAIEYEKYFDIDFNASGLMTISRNVNIITIEIEIGWDFTTFSTTTGATSNITPESGPEFFISTTSLQVHPTLPCEYVDIDITTNIQATEYRIGSTAPIAVATNPFTVSLLKGVPRKLIVMRDGAEEINVYNDQYDSAFYDFYFNKIYDENVTIDIVPDAWNGATVTINVDFLNQQIPRPNVNTLQYSLDDVSYTADNVFTGQASGDYTIYIKDSWGCVFSKDYTVTDSGTREPYFFISNVNSINFAKDEVWDGVQNGIHKNLENTLSTTEFGKRVQYDERLIYRTEDVIRIQFKSSYQNHFVTLQTCEGNAIQYEPTVEKQSNNLDIYESLDGFIDNYNGQAGVYFTSGNVYNEVGTDIGNYQLNGNLPDFAIIGVVVKLGSFGSFPIKNIIYDKDLDKNILLFDYVYSGGGETIRLESIYDILPFDVYEFEIDFDSVVIQGNPPNDDIRVRIQATDSLFDELNYYSEYISLFDTADYNLDKYIAINYYNENNRDIFYLYGITHFIRAEVESAWNIIIDEVDVVKGDRSSYLSQSTVYNGIKIKFAQVTTNTMIKIALALSSEYLFINGLGYVKNGSLDIKEVEGTNIYDIEVELISTGKSFSIEIENRTGIREGYSTTYIPKILNGNIGLIKL